MRTFPWTFSFVVLSAACGGSDLAGADAPLPDSPLAADAPRPDAAPPDAAARADAMPAPDLDRSACVPDESGPVQTDRCGAGGDSPTCNLWIKIDVPDAVCSDGSQYKIFVNYSNTSDDVEVMFEPGGACWDYPSCSGSGGVRGAANPHGIPDDHMSTYQILNLLRRDDTTNPVAQWNMVFIPYCTGDIHTGNKVATYPNPAGGDPLVFRHVGHDNTMKSIAWINEHFTHIPRLLVTGCSAGGIGALQNYFYVRSGLDGVGCSYLLDDSGPAMHSDGPSRQLHETIRAAWNLDPLLEDLRGKLNFDVDALKNDFGLINAAVADQFPHDRLSLAVYRMDLNYSLYSYQRFFPGSTEADIHALWWQDLQELIETYQSRSNLAYFIPNFRHDNCSHCVSIPPVGHDLNTIITMPWLGSEIQQDGLDLRQFTIDLLDHTKPLKSYLEDAIPTEMFTPDESSMCMMGG